MAIKAVRQDRRSGGFMGQVIKQMIMRLIKTWCEGAPGAGAQVLMHCALDSDNVPIILRRDRQGPERQFAKWYPF